MLPGGLTYFQQESMNRLNLQSVGYMGTSPDGNCMFNGVSQGLSGMSAAAICLLLHSTGCAPVMPRCSADDHLNQSKLAMILL
jgi:hypothetical protein